MTSFNACHIKARDALRKKIEEDTRNYRAPITVVAPNSRALDHSKPVPRHQSAALSYRKAEVLAAERRAAERARKAKPRITSMQEILTRHQIRSGGLDAEG